MSFSRFLRGSLFCLLEHQVHLVRINDCLVVVEVDTHRHDPCIGVEQSIHVLFQACEVGFRSAIPVVQFLARTLPVGLRAVSESKLLRHFTFETLRIEVLPRIDACAVADWVHAVKLEEQLDVGRLPPALHVLL